MSSFSEQVEAAVAMLPVAGSEEVFDDFKARLLAANPENGAEVLRWMLKSDLAKPTLRVGEDKKPKLVLMRPASGTVK